jgi:hypothetical protein
VNLDRFIVRVPFQVIFLHEPLFLNGPIYGEQVIDARNRITSKIQRLAEKLHKEAYRINANSALKRRRR